MTDTQRWRARIAGSSKRVRVYLRGRLVGDTLRPLLVWEVPYYPTYYVPFVDISADLEPNGGSEHHDGRGTATGYDVVVDGLRAEGAAVRYADSAYPDLKDAVRLEFGAFDWFEEDEPIFVHPRDPYSRVDILASSRNVRVEVDGVTVADSSSPRILFETGLPARYYLPLPDVRMDLLTPSDTHSSCPYKGTADYWHVEVEGAEHRDIVWIYRTPLPESQKIAGLACFYNEKVDIFVDGVLQERPDTPFS
ncbi:DUF427 domain-containing protein [Nocardia sp. NPDC056064]|uniref:DUF427 domain-containing protein n=1 Tax=Nocardia sp. NPDC056064 TaxID=3345701 RepID=UPI0035E0E7D3